MYDYLIDTHAHLDGGEFSTDLTEVLQRAEAAGVHRIFLPAIDLPSTDAILALCRKWPDRLSPMIGLHPEEVNADYRKVLDAMYKRLKQSADEPQFIAIGEVGLDFYWSREFEKEQLEAFEQQVQWSLETRLPLMIHCRKAQNEMVNILRKYASDLPGGVFHCFTGNAIEAVQLLSFDCFMLGIGGVSTFKKNPLPEMLPATVPLERIVLETDSPYMAPVPHRGQRNEPAFVREVALRLADAYGVTIGQVARQTTANAKQLFLKNHSNDITL